MGTSVRKSRNYKEKSSMLALGHIALPLAAVIALGLLFLGIRLFFMSPSSDDAVVFTADSVPQESTAQTAQPAAPQDTAHQDAASPMQEQAAAHKDETVESDVVLASPAGSRPTSAPAAQSTKPSAQTKPQSTAAAKPRPQSQPAAQASGKTGASAGAAFGVQIGSFAEKSRADSVVADVAKLGYTATVSQVQSNGKMFYRVRVRSGSTRESAERMSAELEKKGYPVLVVTNP